MSKKKVVALDCLTAHLSVIKQKTENYQNKADDKREKELKQALAAYAKDVADFMEQGAITSDPYGIVTKTNIGDPICAKLIDEVLLEMGGKSGRGSTIQMISTSVEIATRSAYQRARGFKSMMAGKFANGWRWCFNPNDGKLTMILNGVRHCIQIVKKKLIDFGNYVAKTSKRIYGWFLGLFNKNESEDDVQKLEGDTPPSNVVPLTGELCPA